MHFLNVSRSLLFQSSLLRRFWGEAVLNAVFMVYRTPYSILNGKTPFESIYKRLPVFDNIMVFGCLCFATKLNNNDNCFSNNLKNVFLLAIEMLKKKVIKSVVLIIESFLLFWRCEIL